MTTLRDQIDALAAEWETEAARRIMDATFSNWLDRRALQLGADFERNHAARLRSLLARHPAPSPSVSRDAALKAQGFEDVRPVGGCADVIGLAPSPRSEAEGTRAPACHCGDVLRERPCPFCSPEAYYGAGRAPVPAESATKGET